MARVRVPVDETSDEAISAKAAQLLGEERAPKTVVKPRRQKPNLPKISRANLVVVATGVVFLVVVVLLVKDRSSLQKQVDDLSKQPANAQNQSANETANLQTDIGKFMELPADETPTLATVSDVEKVKDQTFFHNAQNGDKVLLYSKAGKAILYRPSTKKVIEVAQINPSGSGNPTTQP